MRKGSHKEHQLAAIFKFLKKQWHLQDQNSKLFVNVRYGARVIELAKGKTAVEVASTADLVPTLELIKHAVEAGELDVQIAAASEKLREGFGR